MTVQVDGAYVFSPSGWVFNETSYQRGIQWLGNRFGTVSQSEHALAREERFAGSDTDRVAAIEFVQTLPGRQLLIASRGGYGLSRLLPQLNMQALAQYLNQSGSILCGHSDVTVLQLALLDHGCEPGRLLHGPMVCFDLGAETPDTDMLQWFEKAISGNSWSVAWEDPVTQSHTPGEFQGKLWGGNLAMVCSLISTPWMPTLAQSGGVLFLEDVNEHPYRVERMLLQLHHAGILQQQRAILLGEFSDWNASPIDNHYNLHSAVKYTQSLLDIPVIAGLPFGHVPRKMTLPMGSQVTVRTHAHQITLEFPPL